MNFTSKWAKEHFRFNVKFGKKGFEKITDLSKSAQLVGLEGIPKVGIT